MFLAPCVDWGKQFLFSYERNTNSNSVLHHFNLIETRGIFVHFDPRNPRAQGQTDLFCPFSLSLHSSLKLAEPVTAWFESSVSAADVSHVSRPCDKARWRTLLFSKCRSRLSLLSFLSFQGSRGALHGVRSWGWENIFQSIPCSCSWPSEKSHWGDTREPKAASYCILAVGLMTHLSSDMEQDPGTSSESSVKDSNGRWLIGNWGKWWQWYWYHNWCNGIETAMTYVHIHFLLDHLAWGWGRSTKKKNQFFYSQQMWFLLAKWTPVKSVW